MTKYHDPRAPALRKGVALDAEAGAVIEVDYYHAQTLLTLDDAALAAKAKADLDTMLGPACKAAAVVDAAVVRLPQGVNWYYPGSYADLPEPILERKRWTYSQELETAATALEHAVSRGC